jgi:cardiolipin synthase A/B
VVINGWRRLVWLCWGALLLLVVGACESEPAFASNGAAKQESLNEWRALTASNAAPPYAFVKGDAIRVYFAGELGVECFSARWRHQRVPTGGYRVHSAVLRWRQRLRRIPKPQSAWREAVVLGGPEWRRLATNLVAALTPKTPWHAAYYQAFLADRVLYRDAQGRPQLVPLRQQPGRVMIDRRFSIEETLEILGRLLSEELGRRHPGENLFLLMTPSARGCIQPLLVDLERHECVLLEPAALYDTTDRGLGLAVTAQGLKAMLFDSIVVALIKNPVSSVARLGNLGVQTVVKLLRPLLPRFGGAPGPLTKGGGMDLKKWEGWLNEHTGTREQDGSLQLLIDGDRFFKSLEQGIAQATNHIDILVYIFDKDDVAVQVADQLKRRSARVKVRVILDEEGSIAAGVAPPATPMPEGFLPPSSIVCYLRRGSHVKVRPFLNPWFSADHSKLFLVDGSRAWLGGMNIGREYRYEWHDLMVEVRGPVVGSLEETFRRDWAHAGPLGDLGYLVALLTSRHTPPPRRPPGPWIKVRLLPTKTLWKPFATAILGSLRHAQSYLYVENPYLFDKRIIIGLVAARKRGVDVRVVLPSINDFKTGGRGNLVIANYLLEHKVRVYFYPGMTHVKALLADGWACLGSGNLNHLSLRLNQEDNIATSDPVFAAELKEQLFDEDFAHSYELKHPISVDWLDFLADVILEGF